MEKLPVTLQASRRKMGALLTASAVFVVVGVWLFPREPLAGGLCIAFFGLGAVIFAVNMHPRSSFLTLTSDGFTFASLFRKHFVAWSDVQSFSVARIGLNKMVCWNYSPEYRGHSKLRRFNTGVSGIEAGLPDTYGMEPQALCRLLSDLREQHGTSAR